jgi:hypothetical protein
MVNDMTVASHEFTWEHVGRRANDMGRKVKGGGRREDGLGERVRTDGDMGERQSVMKQDQRPHELLRIAIPCAASH